jgi:hypothetical protein
MFGLLLASLGLLGAFQPEMLAAIFPPVVLAFFTSQAAVVAGLVITLATSFLLWVTGRAENGVRVMIRFLRNESPSSFGDIEWLLRYFGVGYRIERLKEDSERGQPASVMLDMAFEPGHFAWHPVRHSIVYGIMSRIFERSRHGNVRIFVAAPYKYDAKHPQIPKEKPRRWWTEGFDKWRHSAIEKIEASFVLSLRQVLHNLPLLGVLVVVAFVLFSGAPWAKAITTAIARLFGAG